MSNSKLSTNLTRNSINKSLQDIAFNHNTKKDKISKPIWLHVSEAAKLGGVNNKTIRRAIKYNYIKFKIIGNRYLIDFNSIIRFLHTKTKLKNKFYQFGLGQYVDKWK